MAQPLRATREFSALPQGLGLTQCDTMRLLFRFLAERRSTEPTQVAVEQIDDALDFLRDLRERRGNSVATCNQRLVALHSLFRFIARLVPELVDHAARVQAVPCRRAPFKPAD